MYEWVSGCVGRSVSWSVRWSIVRLLVRCVARWVGQSIGAAVGQRAGLCWLLINSTFKYVLKIRLTNPVTDVKVSNSLLITCLTPSFYAHLFEI